MEPSLENAGDREKQPVDTLRVVVNVVAVGVVILAALASSLASVTGS